MKQDKLSNHYTGNIADGYEESRKKGQKWQNEDAAIERMLNALPNGLKVIDVPVGTGRFFETYANNNLIIEGVDISPDMLREAEKHPFAAKTKHHLCEGSIFDLKHPDNSFDLALCIRFLNLVNTESVEKSLQELARVSNTYIIAGIRHLVPRAEINMASISGIKTLIRQSIARLTERKIELHTKSDVNKIFENLGLQITDQECIQKRGDGTDYYIYLLEKK